jgi:PilZ domain-containing protein
MTRDASAERPAVTLCRQYHARVLDVSVAGCLIEVDATLAPGTVGALEVQIDGIAYRESVRVARVVPARHITMRNQVGLEFLVLTPPGTESLRAVIARLSAGAELTITFIH